MPSARDYGAFGPMHRAQGPGQKALTKKGRKRGQKRKKKKVTYKGGLSLIDKLIN